VCLSCLIVPFQKPSSIDGGGVLVVSDCSISKTLLRAAADIQLQRRVRLPLFIAAPKTSALHCPSYAPVLKLLACPHHPLVQAPAWLLPRTRTLPFWPSLKMGSISMLWVQALITFALQLGTCVASLPCTHTPFFLAFFKDGQHLHVVGAGPHHLCPPS